jgi:hypothetical protein
VISRKAHQLRKIELTQIFVHKAIKNKEIADAVKEREKRLSSHSPNTPHLLSGESKLDASR